MWAIEGTGGYGAGLARFLAEHGERVLEVDRPARNDERHAGQERRARRDPRGARRCSAASGTPQPRAGGVREALRALVTTRAGAIAARTAAINQLEALIVERARAAARQLRGLPLAALVAAACACGPSSRATRQRAPVRSRCAPAPGASARSARKPSSSSARSRCTSSGRAAAAGRARRRPDQRRAAPARLVAPRPLPPRSRASPRLAGVAPIPASIGPAIRYRLDRGGDRQLNRALHTIILSRRQHHHATIAYLDRRHAEGKTSREAVRCLKRYLARHLFRLLEARTDDRLTTIEASRPSDSSAPC